MYLACSSWGEKSSKKETLARDVFDFPVERGESKRRGKKVIFFVFVVFQVEVSLRSEHELPWRDSLRLPCFSPPLSQHIAPSSTRRASRTRAFEDESPHATQQALLPPRRRRRRRTRKWTNDGFFG